jgi:putative oxidoreductase
VRGELRRAERCTEALGGFQTATSVKSRLPPMPRYSRELTRGLGSDAVWDCVGGNDFFQLSLSCARLGGAVIVLGAP